MVTRVTADFESPETAELALKQIRDNVRGVYSTNYVYNRISDKAQKLHGGTNYTILPAAVTSHNYLTAVLESPATDSVIPEPLRNRKTTVFIVCDGSGTNEIHSILSAMGGNNIYSPKY
ncbi:MAG: hypothetical protein K2I00_07610 [Ruminococcus sp.]|nr:hypothetical protein [Ruminococcus sp.]